MCALGYWRDIFNRIELFTDRYYIKYRGIICMRYISCISRRTVGDIGGSKNHRVESGYRWQANQISALYLVSITVMERKRRAQSYACNQRITIATRVHSPVIKVSARPFVRANRAFLACHLLMRTNASRATLLRGARIFRTNGAPRLWTSRAKSQLVEFQRRDTSCVNVSDRDLERISNFILNKIARVIFL